MKILRLTWILSGLALSAVACGDSAGETTTTTTTSASVGGSSMGGAGGMGGMGGAGAGIGLPSDQYPAPHGPVPQVVNGGGKVLAQPKVIPIVFQGDDASQLQIISELTSKIGGGDYWKAVTQEYGVGPLTSNSVVTVLETPPATLSGTDIDTWLATKLNNDDLTIPAPVGDEIYTIFYPLGVTIGDSSGKSCVDFGGYHLSLTLNAAHGSRKVAYAVLPRCTMFYSLGLVDALTTSTSHELIEAATDPYPTSTPAFGTVDADHRFWLGVYGGGEVGDMCNLPLEASVVLPGTTYNVQRSWSNAQASAGHDPCVPTLPGRVYSNAVPDLPDTLKGGILSGKGIQIAAGGTRTVDVPIFSEGPANAVKVLAEDWSEITGGPKQLELSFDQFQGKNGQTLHLTIHVVGTQQRQLFRISAFDGKGWTYWIGLVGR